MKHKKSLRMVLCALFTALVAAGAWIQIPSPTGVPFTLQFLFTLLAGLLLGAKLGTLSVCLYLVIGLLGVPIFAQGGGIGYVLQPSFGYLIGFALGTLATGVIAGKDANPSFKRLLAAGFAGLVIVYALGLVYYYCINRFYLNNPPEVWPMFVSCCLLTLPGDIANCLVGALLGKRLIPLLKKYV